MTRDEAVKIVARRVVADLVDLHIGDEWENYPDVLEEAWYEVQASAGALAEFPNLDAYERAYALLSSPRVRVGR